MPINNMNMDEGVEIDFSDALENGLPDAGDPGVQIAGVTAPQQPRGAEDIPHIEVTPNFEPSDAVQYSEANALTAGMAEISAELAELKSDRGRYGREVVGPLRAENDDLKARIGALETRTPEPVEAAPAAPAPEPTYQDVAVALYGDDVDVEDPTVVRDSKAHLTALRLGQSGRQEILAAVRDEIGTLRQELGASTAYTQAGAPTREQVQAAIKANPELADLPVSKVVSFVGRNLNASRGTAVKPQPIAGAVPSYADPNMVVDGGSTVFSNPAETTEQGEQALKDLVGIREKVGFGHGQPSVADLQAAKLNKMFAGQAFN